MEMDHAVAESALVQQLKSQADVVRQGGTATSHSDGGEEQMALVNQTELQCLRSESWTAYGDIASRSRFELLNRLGSSSRSIRVRALDTCSRLFE
jgi:hypothetical protein